MNTITDQRPPPLQPPRASFSCDLHPHDNYTGFCSTCLRERLTILDQSCSSSTSTITAAAPVNSTSASEAYRNNLRLRRTKSLAASKHEGLPFFTGVFEPQRKSCDVRGRNTLSALFSIDDENEPGCSSSMQRQITLKKNKEEYEEDKVNNHEDGDEIRVSEDQEVKDLNDLENDIVQMEAEIDAIVDNLKSVKERIDPDAHSKKPSLSNFWSAASVLSKKWQKWRRKQKKNVGGRNRVVSSSKLKVQKRISEQYRETQSEIADYGFGRRSCDIGPRFSLDAGRFSLDDPRYSFDEPRASWDGYSIGRSFPRLQPTVESIPVVKIPRSDMQIPVEEPVNSAGNIPGGSIQTREYYLDSSSKRRKSLDRSSSIRKMAAAVVAEIDARNAATTTTASNKKVSPASVDYNHKNHVHRSKFHSIGGEIELERDLNSNSNSNSSETFDKEAKKSRWWKWKLWGSHNRNRGDELTNGFNQKLGRSNSSTSWRNSSYNVKKSNSVKNNKNPREVDDIVSERNRSARYSPNHVNNNGLLRFYLTPLQGSRRSGIGTTKSRLSSNSKSITRNMFRL